LKGIRVLESFSATGKGAEGVVSSTKANVIKPVPGKQAAATIGGGVNIDELNKELRKSGLYAIGAAHGMDTGLANDWTNGNRLRFGCGRLGASRRPCPPELLLRSGG
jgi:hypothetical protein